MSPEGIGWMTVKDWDDFNVSVGGMPNYFLHVSIGSHKEKFIDGTDSQEGRHHYDPTLLAQPI